MCGIAGAVSDDLVNELLAPRVRDMTDAQRHRGPDDSGLENIRRADPAVVFGHRRLAIIDLTPAGHQPMHDPASNVWITFNGEIYNYRELRGHLERCGQLFSSDTDTEVILKAYAFWGPDCVRHLRGIFAFAIWQPETGEMSPRLLLARDQLGVKPLYYWWDGQTLLFASEVRALLATGLVERRLDPAGLRSYLAYGSVQDPLTLLQGVHSLLPGHTLQWQDGRIALERYWRLPSPEQVSRETPTDLHVQLREQLFEAVRLQLVADVPIGTFLSGGIDSTVIAALTQRASPDPIKTFGIAFEEKQFDESFYSTLASRHIGTIHKELVLTNRRITEGMSQAIAAFDQPSVDGLNTYFISKVVREAGLTVALSGLGGDELFGGYDGYRKALLAERWARRLGVLPSSLRSFCSKLTNRLAMTEGQRKMSALIESPNSPYLLTRRLFSERQISDLLLPDLVRASARWEPGTFKRIRAETAGYDAVNRASAWEIQTYMVSTLLRDTDQMSMAHALEVRVPLIDHRLVEYMFTIEGLKKTDPSQPKPLLTLPLGGALPVQCVHRRKQGFELPFSVWLRQHLGSRIRDNLVGPSSDKHLPFRKSGLVGIWDQFERGCLSWSRVWSLYVLRNWLEEHRMIV